MIIKANKQIGFIYKNNESIDKILKDGEVVFEKGFLREKTSTTLPITFGGVGKNLKDYRVYGNTVQNGTPTPETPIEMVSCGDRTKNLLPTNVSDWEQGTISATTGQNQESATRIRTKEYYEIKNDKDYYISLENNYYVFLNIILYDSNKSYLGQYYSIDSSVNGAINLKINIPSSTISNVKYYRVILRKSNNSATITPEEISTIKPMITLGDTKLDFEPYGYKIPVNVRSDNLFDKDNANILNGYLTGTATSGNLVLTGSGSNRVFYIKCKPNRTYTIQKGIIDENRFRVGTTENIPSVSQSVMNYQNNDNMNFITFTTNSNSNYLIVHFYNTASNVTLQDALNTIQIVEGSTTSSKYIPYYNETTNIYLDEPLRKIGEYSDFIDFINDKVIRNIDEIVLDGSESWADSKITRDVLTHRFRTLGTKSHVVDVGLSNKFIVKDSEMDIYNDVEMVQLSSSTSNTYIGLKIYINRLLTNDVSGLTNWLSSNPVTLDYVLLTPTEESITLPNIPTIDGNNTLNIETEITPSQVYIKYKSNT